MIRYHMGAPPNSDTYENSQGTANIANVLASGTNENNSFKSKLDYIAGELQMLKNANVRRAVGAVSRIPAERLVLVEQGDGGAVHPALAIHVQLPDQHQGAEQPGLALAIEWLAQRLLVPGQGVPRRGRPRHLRDQPAVHVDVHSARNIIGTTVPITLHETGVVPQPSTMFPTAAPWVLWNIWAGYQTSENSVANIQSAYSSSYTITRDEVPNLK